jgi:host factor-I protein
MKDGLDSLTAVPPIEQEEFANRKLIRPSLNRNDHSHNHNAAPVAERRDRTERSDRMERSERSDRPDRQDRGDRPERNERNHDRNNGGGMGRKNAPAEQTNAENFYYQKQMQAKTPMVVVLKDGEQIHGVIEWYDKACIKLTRNGAPNLMIYKPSIKYMYKEGENSRK